ncbi:acetyl/propionyl/methylcrotonyl-CoA carboxylase subunit alpha [Salipiger mucosus]|uniref:Methylcrotonyl-CoA carboxylase biotin-containing subunit n=1 Tax=Salipiger mucosus DSM 16094 TaxID=1123237 RepID=S9QQE9_9RHOB|nr:acetyl/propionyl/methylcrotonyl-CoA carboxylase subunit alpha [Salipiger mucosus]EPX83596.1 Methylcrotonyl-CoA carboxylase biotin-containing subunit [Salipiger mucosus DSM 16094]
MTQTFSKILIANRGEIAARVIRTAHRMGIATVAVYSDADAQALHVALADEAVHIGPSPASESYLMVERIIDAARATGAQAIHPGYGFLSENPDFVDAVEAAGLTFIGPSSGAIRAMGLKDAAKDLMARAGVPIVPGYQGESQDPDFLAAEAQRIGYPVLIKARAGGGGKGMRKVDAPQEFAEALESARREGQASFGDPHVLIEKYVTAPRHIEVQVFGDNHGQVVHLFERDCSLQRRHQKVIEEAPAPGMTDAVRRVMTEAAVKAAEAIDYSGAGTIEFIADGSGPLREDGFWFMEMNTRLQVEHPVTEAVTGVDLVEWQIRVAAGLRLPLAQDQLAITGHAFEARLYAEDPVNGFLPATGTLEHLSFSDAARNDTGVRSGDAISPFYDPMIAKIISHAPDRESARRALLRALRETHVVGTATNAEFLAALADHPGFAGGTFDTGLIGRDLESLIAETPPSDVHVAIAALAALGVDPGTPRLGWRLWGDAVHDLTFVIDGAPFSCRLALQSGGHVCLYREGAEALALTGLSINEATVHARTGSTNEKIEATVRTARRDTGLLISVLTGGIARTLLLPDARAGSAALVDASDSVVAPMTGVIVALDVVVGDQVQEGSRLGVMEAMKMETALVSPRIGTVSEVLCAAGDAVEGGAILVNLEAEAS